MAGLLNTLKKNWRGLLDEVQAAPESLRALTQPAAAQQFDAALRKGGTIDKEKAVQMAMDVLQTTPMGVIGKIVYHGSPHKFDKFDLSKIGTGEGAQAYGHGLYLAESPDVAKSYQTTNVFRAFDIAPEAEKRGLQLSAGARGELIRQASANPDPMIAARRLQYANASTREIPQEKLADLIKGYQEAQSGSLYKVDIPDESIPKMLDWDKPLSEQAPEVQSALQRAAEIRAKQTGNAFRPLDMGQLGREVVPSLGEGRLRESGIPGIRYLDGGSRSAGEGTSNFVLFDDRLPRILERNGQATGLQPWAPGEWKGLLD